MGRACAARLGVPYRRIGGVMVALRRRGGAARLERTLLELERGRCSRELLDIGRKSADIEPLVTAKCVAGLLMPDEGVIDPMALTTAYARPGSNERGVGSSRCAGGPNRAPRRRWVPA